VGLGDGEDDGDGEDGRLGNGAALPATVAAGSWVAVTVVAVGGVPCALSKKTSIAAAAPMATTTAPQTASAERKLVCSIRA
jgi:hypothetical protein